MFALYNSASARIYSIGGQVQTFATAEEAQASEQIVFGYKVMPLSEAITALRDYFVEVTNTQSSKFRALQVTVETFLEEGYEGALDGDEFIEEHKALAEAVGFEYEEEKTYTIAVTVTAKHRRGYFINTYDFEVGVESQTDDVEVIDFDIDCVDEQ
jgi:hypothetical protein